MNFEKGKIYFFNDTTSLNLKDLKSFLDDKGFNLGFLNFPEDYSIKVDSFYERLENNTIINLGNEIENIIKEKLLLEDADYSEKMFLTLYYLLKEKNIVIVNTAGMSFESIDYLKKYFHI
ncbi:Uncharacterised protein [Chryseobacterium gleum]|uniref:Uncharacterized protein n=2 Tax=Chryseobacterium gleum TaxID=250 RepID=A0A3S4ME09_CHRGE|nr:hypothetical protein [Chryseobacterium gleum]EFK37577.1 hypothetical protein HMPREF0204_10350 [Chryseobacterium gleum ATCC 35910]QQY32933.1 hypothetical protein I6I60_03855 [Chryseobacterium gleum]VEE09815.1 Uncharacterised protein [Chryseobacterium gleum]